MGSTAPVIDIVIVGGGISGLALAAGLCKKPHLSVRVYEGAPGYKDIGAGLALHKNAIGAMSLIGPEVLKAYLDNASNIGEDDVEMVTEVIMAHGPHAGELVAELGRAKGRKSISRADLLHGLVQLIPKDRIKFGKKLVHMQERIPDIGKVKNQLLFHDGSTAEADCVIGADGIHSKVRAYLLGPSHPATRPKNHDRWQVYRTLIPTQEAITKHGIDPRYTNIVSIMTGPNGHVNIVPLKKGTMLSAGVAVRGISTPSPPPTFSSVMSALTETPPKLDPSLYESYHPIAQPIIKMIASPSTPNTATWSVGDHDHAPFYIQRQIAMMGDAAHASLPFAGNGAAQALEDAAVLDHLFGRVTQVDQIQAALLAYETVRIKRSQEVGDMARRFGRVYAHCGDDDKKMPPLVQDPKRLRRFFAEASAFTNDFDLVKQNQDAVEEFELLCRKFKCSQ
ncbi:hypothetical protein V8F06_012477 [Rhypophila decipiens]